MRAYWGGRGNTSRALAALERRTGWPRYIFWQEAHRLGIVGVDRRRGWTREEMERLRDQIGSASVRAIARALGRSAKSVRRQAQRLELSTRLKEGYDLAELRQSLGESEYKVRAWLRRGLFGGGWECGRVSAEAVAAFLKRHPYEYDSRRMDQDWYKSMLLGRMADYRL